MKKFLVVFYILMQAAIILSMERKSKDTGIGLGSITQAPPSGIVTRYGRTLLPPAPPLPTTTGTTPTQPFVPITTPVPEIVIQTGTDEFGADIVHAEQKEEEEEPEYDFYRQSFLESGPSGKPATPSKPYDYAVVTFNAENKNKHIGLICIHGTWATYSGMGVDTTRAFSYALQKYAEKIAQENDAAVTMLIPQWSGDLSMVARTAAAEEIDKTLFELDAKRPFNDLHGIAHSHGCNVLLTLARIAAGSHTFNVEGRIRTMVLIAPPTVKFKELYDFPEKCKTYALYSRHDATQIFGSIFEGEGLSARIPIEDKYIGRAYNIAVEHLPESINPHHRSIKTTSLIDCLPAIQAQIESTYKNYPDLKLWIARLDHTFVPLLTINDPRTTESDADKRTIAEEKSKIAESLIAEFIQAQKSYFGLPQYFYLITNFIRERLYKDPRTPSEVPVTEEESETKPLKPLTSLARWNPFARSTPASIHSSASSSSSSSSSAAQTAQPEGEEETEFVMD